MDLASKAEKVSRLLDWLASEGCIINQKIQYPAIFQNGLIGLAANQVIELGEELTVITPQVIFSTELLKNCEISTIFDENLDYFGKENPEWLDNQFLALFVYEKIKATSKWQKFFDVMPDEIENLCDWSDDELEELFDEDLENDVQIRRNKNKSSYNRLKEITEKYPGLFYRPVELSEIEWSWKIIWTRSFMRSPSHSALVPYSDFINHGESNTSFYFSDQKESEEPEIPEDYDEIYETHSIERFTTRDLYEINFSSYESPDEDLFEKAKTILIESDLLLKEMKLNKESKDKVKEIVDPAANFIVALGQNERYDVGQQILFEYGGYSNTSLLIHYGFALEINRHEFYRLKVKISEILIKPQIKYLPLKYDPESYSLFLINAKELNKSLVMTLRASLWKPKYQAQTFFRPKDLALELKVMAKYCKILRKILGKVCWDDREDQITIKKGVRGLFAVLNI